MLMDEIETDLKGGSISPIAMDSLNTNESGYAVSADDLAWADSCLIKFTEASDNDWSSFKESLLEILNEPTEPVTLLAADYGSSDNVDLGDNRTFASGESIATTSMLIDSHSDFTDEDVEDLLDGEDDAVDDVIRTKKKERLKGKIVLEENALLADHAEFVKVASSDLGFDLGSWAFEVETSSSHGIFKVWDLGVFDEQDEFTKELNKALEESSPHAIASTSGVTERGQDLAVEPLDDLITGISGLSLAPSSN